MVRPLQRQLEPAVSGTGQPLVAPHRGPPCSSPAATNWTWTPNTSQKGRKGFSITIAFLKTYQNRTSESNPLVPSQVIHIYILVVSKYLTKQNILIKLGITRIEEMTYEMSLEII